jgi:hypothetical protein
MPSLSSLAGQLAQLRDVHAYDDAGMQRKEVFHKLGRSFLRQLAKELELPPKSFDLRSNQGGMAVSGEVTLHAEKLYVQLDESAIGGGGITVLYRSCRGRRDYSGGSNQWAHMRQLAESNGAQAFVAHCAALQSSALGADATRGQALRV